MKHTPQTSVERTGRYRKVLVRTWSDEKFRALTPLQPSGQALWLFLMTGPHTGPIPGLFRAGRASMAEELGWPLKAFDQAFAEVSAQGMAKADFMARLVWLPNAVKHNRPESPNVVTSWAKEFKELPECDLKQEVLNVLLESTRAIGEAFEKAFVKAFGKPAPMASPKAMPNQEQEQEQVQEQVQEQKVPSPSGSGASSPPAHWAADLPYPQPRTDTADLIFALGLPLLTAAGVTERNSRSMLGLLRKTNGDLAVIAALERCAVEKPLQPVPWLQAVLKVSAAGATVSKSDRIAQANAAMVRKFAESTQ